MKLNYIFVNLSKDNTRLCKEWNKIIVDNIIKDFEKKIKEKEQEKLTAFLAEERFMGINECSQAIEKHDDDLTY